MIAALLIGRKGSVGFPGKNLTPVLGRPLAWYPIMAAIHARGVDGVYLSTDDSDLMDLANRNGVQVIERPSHLCTAEALGEEAFQHGYLEIARRIGEKPQSIVLLFCNAPTLLPSHIEQGVTLLETNPELDSAVTVSQYNWYAPPRARCINDLGLLEPFIPFENYPNADLINCDRNSQGDCYFADVSVSVVRSHCLDDLAYGVLPQRWMGQRIHPIANWGGLDVDQPFQIPLAEYWLKAHGFTENTTPYKIHSDGGDS